MALETVPVRPINEQSSSPRISFSADFLDEANFISINPHSQQGTEKAAIKETERDRARAAAEFEFLASNVSSASMLTADELFFDGKLLPFWQTQQAEKLNKISLKTKDGEPEEEEEQVVSISSRKKSEKEEKRESWFVDDDPSPRPPKCTVLWKELLRLKKQRASSLSPSSSSSSTSSSSSSLGDIATEVERKCAGNKEKPVKSMKKRLERTRSATIRIRPMINVPICTQTKNSSLPPLFPPRKGRVPER